jgi:hypothetical protein
MAYPDHIDTTERRIISRILKDALAAGYTVSVFDGEEWPVKSSTKLGEITAEIAATDETTLRFRKDGASIGSLLLVHGNGCDVICDYTATDAMEALMSGAEALARQLDV